MSSREPAPPAKDTGAVCGNGVAEEIAGTCEKRCHGGCDGPIECELVCATSREHCDGADVGSTCESQGYAAGTMRCTSACLLDDEACLACVPGPDARCGTTGLAGDEPFAVADGKGAAVFVRDATTGDLTGVRVDARLKTRPLPRLPRATVAAGALDGSLGFVDRERRFGTLAPATGRARLHGPIGADSTPVHILRERAGTGGAAVLTGDYQRRTLAVFDGPRTRAGEPRHFALDNWRVVVIPGAHELARGATTAGRDLAILAFGGDVLAYERDGLELVRLPAIPAGISLAFTYPRYTDTLTWSTGSLTASERTSPGDAAPPPGLSRAAISGAARARAFDGVLFASAPRGPTRRIELYWSSAATLAAPP